MVAVMAASGLWHVDGGIREATWGRWHQVFWLSNMFILSLTMYVFLFSSLSEKEEVLLYFCCSPFYMQQWSFGGSVRMATWGWQVEDSNMRMAVSSWQQQDGGIIMVSWWWCSIFIDFFQFWTHVIFELSSFTVQYNCHRLLSRCAPFP